MKIFVAYSHVDEQLRHQLDTHLALLRRQGAIDSWTDRRITAGQEWRSEIGRELDAAEVILLLVSADFLASDFCYTVEMKRALERHELGTARVVPVILRECDWEGAPFSKLQALPQGAVPVTSWENRDKAWTSVAKSLRQIVQELSTTAAEPPAPEPVTTVAIASALTGSPLLLVDFKHRVTEKNTVWWRYSWQATLRNNTSHYVLAAVIVHFFDDDGFLLETDGGQTRVSIGPGDQQTIREAALLSVNNASRVGQIRAEPRFDVVRRDT